jgi:hypothetical protein
LLIFGELVVIAVVKLLSHSSCKKELVVTCGPSAFPVVSGKHLNYFLTVIYVRI